MRKTIPPFYVVVECGSRDRASVTSRAVTLPLRLFGLTITAIWERGLMPPLFCKTSTPANGLFSCLGYYVQALLKGHVPPVQWLKRLDNTGTLTEALYQFCRSLNNNFFVASSGHVFQRLQFKYQ